MKISIEAKVGIIGIATLAMVIWGINYLKGRNILSSTYSLNTFYEDSGGLEASAPVFLKGVKIGFVDEIALHPEEPVAIRVRLSIEKDYTMGEGSVAMLYSADLMGTRAIRIVPSGGSSLLRNNDTIDSAVEPDLLATLQEQVYPVIDQFGQLAGSLETVAQKLDTIITTEAGIKTLENLSSITTNLKNALEPGGSLYRSLHNLESFTTMLQDQEEEIESIASHINSISQTIDSADLGRLSEGLIDLADQMNRLMEQVNSGEGNTGKLFYSDSLYTKLELLVEDLDNLIADLNENPQDYVHFSLFGRSQEKN